MLHRGDQVVYIPSHLRTDDTTIGYPFEYPNGQEPGFVTSGPNANGDYFVRYWRVKDGDIVYPLELRTKANSEATRAEDLVVMSTVSSIDIQDAMKEYCQ